MARLSPIAVVLLIAAVLSAGQCGDVCAFLTQDQPSAASEASLPPCHQSPQKQQPESACSHHEFVAEQHSRVSALDAGYVDFGVTAAIDSATAPHLTGVALQATVVNYPPPRRSPLKTVLRI